jgi:GNAT superfamily N-acetyltransferase
LRICRKFLTFNISAFVCHPLAGTNSSTSNPEECQFSILAEQELLDFSHDPALQLVDTRIKNSLARGEICIGATLDGKLVAYVWRTFFATPHDNKRNIWIDFNAAAAYGRYSFTLPAYRGKHIMPSLLAFADNYCLDKGATCVIGYIETDNYPSIRACMKAGYRGVGYAGFIHLFGKLFSFRTPGAKKHGFRFFTPVSPARTSV